MALISEDLAEKNHLKIGDTVEVKMDALSLALGMSQFSLNLEVQGIFKWEPLGHADAQVNQNPANFLFVPEGLLHEVYKISPTITQRSTVLPEDSFPASGHSGGSAADPGERAVLMRTRWMGFSNITGMRHGQKMWEVILLMQKGLSGLCF